MHAYLIIAHHYFDMLEQLIHALDDPRNDIFIHIDAKVKNFDFARFKLIPKHAGIYFTERVKITWGDFSQVKAEMILLSAAVNHQQAGRRYTYYHLLSGVDIPLVPQDEMHRFFDRHQGKEFVHYTSDTVTQSSVNRIRYYHVFRSKRNTFYKVLANAAYRLQRLFGVNRLRGKNIRVQKGCNWFSITGELAEYIVSQMPDLVKTFRLSYCCDEIFMQTIVENSAFKKQLYMPNCHNDHRACMRLIDWQRGNPYTFKNEDYDLIVHSGCLFARKFSPDVDPVIIERLYKRLEN